MPTACRRTRRSALIAATLPGAALLLAGAADPLMPVPPLVVDAPLPPIPQVEAIPPRPLPPAGAVASMAIPVRDASGTLLTVNARLSPAQATWNLRSALNVAALNCREPQYAALVANYTAFLATHARRLAITDRAVDAEFRKAHGAGFRRARDLRTTQVYNYFALPPTLPAFCDAALPVSAEASLVPSAGLAAFAAEAVPRLDRVFEGFFIAIEQYRVDVAAWDTRYGVSAAQALAAPTAATVAPNGGALIVPRRAAAAPPIVTSATEPPLAAAAGVPFEREPRR